MSKQTSRKISRNHKMTAARSRLAQLTSQRAVQPSLTSDHTSMRVSSLVKRIGSKLSLNDPRWGSDKKDGNRHAQEGKKPGEGPPDLEQLWRDFNQRLSGFFGQKNRPDSGGSSGGGGRPD